MVVILRVTDCVAWSVVQYCWWPVNGQRLTVRRAPCIKPCYDHVTTRRRLSSLRSPGSLISFRRRYSRHHYIYVYSP